jgi:adenine-specific DNA methylase
MIPTTCKRLIEVDFPIAKVSEHSVKEKSIRHGHPSTLHLWWARRPLAACRAVLLGLLLPAPTERECPAEFKSKARVLLKKRHSKTLATDQELQDDLLAFIGEFADWEHAANALYLEIGRGLVRAAHPEETPIVVDPFSGGGSIPLEALRLGCEAFASDLNPVACLILKTLLEDIPRYGNAVFKLPGKDGKEVVVHGLADAIRHVGKQVKDAAEKELAQFYPSDPDGSRPIAYLWARTVRCEGIGCGAEIPLVRSLWLSKKGKKALRYRVERPNGRPPEVAFEVFQPRNETEVSAGTVARANATCPCCHTVLPAVRVRSQLAAQRGGANVVWGGKDGRSGGALLLAVVVQRGGRGREFRVPTSRDYSAVESASRAFTKKAANHLPTGLSLTPDESLPSRNTLGLRLPNYGVQNWSDMFSTRQLLTLALLSEKVRALANNSAVTEQTGALQEMLALAVSRVADYCSANCSLHVGRDVVRNTWARNALPIVWDYYESVPCGEGSGNFDGALDWVAQVAEELQRACPPRIGQIQLADACKSPLPDNAVSLWVSDPPYYNSIGYAESSDFFFVWLKRILAKHPLLRDPFDFGNPLTPKERECIQDDSFEEVFGTKKDSVFFENTITSAFHEGRRVLRDDGVACVVFAHKSTEGWEALLGGLIRSGLVITGSWPIETEMKNKVSGAQAGVQKAMLLASIHLVCRPRPTDTGVGDWTEVKSAMEKRIREWLPTLLKHGIRGADAIFSCLGPALESYSRYERVLTASDREVPLGGDPDATEPEQRGFLAYVFETLSKEALRQVLGDAETEGFEEDARLTALFLWTLQTTKTNGNGGKGEGRREKGELEADEDQDEEEEERPKKAKPGFTMPFDTFIRITRQMGIHYPVLEGRVLEIEKGVVRLLSTKERTEELLGEAAERPGIEISLEDFRQLELGLVEKKRTEAALPTKPRKGKQAAPGRPLGEATFTTLDRIHRAMLLFGLGRSTLLRQVLETEMRQGKRFERLALSLNALYPDGSDERRMLEGVQAAMRGIK